MAMLGLAVLPMVGVILIYRQVAPTAPLPAEDRHQWETASAAAELLAAEQGLEARLVATAANSDARQLVDGVSPAEREAAVGVANLLAAGDRGLVTGLCLVRSLDSTTVRIDTATGAARPDAGCVSPRLVAAAQSAPVGGVVREMASGSDGSRRLIIATELMGTGRRTAGVLAAEVSLSRLFAATPAASGVGTSALLVDTASDSILASARTAAVLGASDLPGTRSVGDLHSLVPGILSGHPGTAQTLDADGWQASVAPLLDTADGVGLGLIHLWPAPAAPDQTLLMATLIIFGLGVLVIAAALATTFLQPFDDLAESQSQLEVLYREAREDSLHDGLTGLGNHRSFQEELDRQLETFARHRVPIALMLIDLDDLKVVNDNEGHPAGDQLLLGMANAIRDTLRYGDRAFRIGGDEFAVILPHTDANEALIAGNRLRHFCLRPAAGERLIPFSGGISSVPLLTSDRNELFRQADAALYRCKRAGRGTVAVFDAERDLVAEDAHGSGSATAVRDIVRARNLQPVYQPIVDLRDGTVVGFEGLIRPGASSPFANPGQLFAAAAESGRIVELDLACFEVVAAGSTSIDPNQVLTINLSPQTLEVEDFSASWLLEILARYQLSPGRIIIELTEREAVTDLDRMRRSMAALQRAGVRLAADDVGAGNAGLRLLSQLRFDIMKIDLSLVQDGTQHDSSRAVVRSLRDLAARQGAVAIAEGVETAEQLRSLQALGITTGQGYLLGRPSSNTAIATVDIDALAAGTRFVGTSPPHPLTDASMLTSGDVSHLGPATQGATEGSTV
jgi:diguanylate cyclase (GGDEF)-like protein